MAANRGGVLRSSKDAERVLTSNPSYEKLARAAVEDHAARLSELDELTRLSEMTEEQAIEIGGKIRRGIHRRIMAKP
jgi:hypothetical protein